MKVKLFSQQDQLELFTLSNYSVDVIYAKF